MRSKEGEAFGYQLTFFRAALKKPDPKAKSAWAAHTIYFAHQALSACHAAAQPDRTSGSGSGANVTKNDLSLLVNLIYKF